MEIVLLLFVLLLLGMMFHHVLAARSEIQKLRSDVERWKKESAPSEKRVAASDPPAVAASQGLPPIVPLSLPEKLPAPKTAPIVPPPVFSGFKTSPEVQPSAAGESWFSRWLKDNPDIEKFIGENLINKIGIAVLVLGVAFFVKYAIDQEWINKTGRVCIGLLCGVLLLWFANRLRKNYHAFSSVLCGGGIAIFYFTIAFAFHQYRLLGQTAAFSCMVLITVFGVLLSILYDRIELGILATAGGFVTPFLVSQGDGNWLVLFTYLLILNAGLIVLAYYKRWRVINFIAFFFTQAIYIGWLVTCTKTPGFNYEATFIFGLVFYLMFLVMNIVHHVLRGSPLKAFDFVILLSVNLCFYGAGMHLIQASDVPGYNGLFTASLGGLNFLLACLFFKRSKADKKFIYLLIGITVSFLSLAAPVQLKGHYITLFWSAEVVVLFWLYRKSFITLLKITALLVTVLMIGSLILDWTAAYSGDWLRPVIFNKGWMTGMCSAVSLYLVFRLLQRETATFFIWGITNSIVRTIYLVAAIVILYAAGALEIADQFTKRTPGTALSAIYLQGYSAVFVLLLLMVFNRKKTVVHPFVPLALPLGVFIWYGLNIYLAQETERSVLTSGKFHLLYLAGFINEIVILLLIRHTVSYIRTNKIRFMHSLPRFTWILSLAAVMDLSALARNLYTWIAISPTRTFDRMETVFDKAGLTIVWALVSFAMIWLGMRYRFKPLRITALVLFGITLTKLFLIDIRNITAGGKILAFILLGVLLLVISFMYQRLKKIIIDEPATPV